MEKKIFPLNTFFIFNLLIISMQYINPQYTTELINNKLPNIGTDMNYLTDMIHSSSSIEPILEKYYEYEISLLVRNNGSQQIIGEHFSILPDYISINDEEYIFIEKKISITESLSTVTLKWGKKINDFSYIFSNLSNITYINFTKFNMEHLINASYMFYNNTDLKYITFGNNSTSSLINMSYIFYNCYSLLSLNLSNFDITNVINMEYMLYNCTNITSIDLSSFSNSNVENMSYMFYHCEKLLSINLSNFYSLKNIDMSFMFFECYSVENIYFSNDKIIYLNKVEYMFYQCTNLKSLDLEKFDTSNVINMDHMFDGLKNLIQLININFDISNVISMIKTFACFHSLKSLDLSKVKVSSNNAINIINMDSMFYHSYGLNYIKFPENLYLKSNNMRYMFYECNNLISLDLTHFDTSLVTDMSDMFRGCYGLNNLNISNFKTSSVKNMNEMFECCHSLKSLDLSNFDIYNTINIKYMFVHCYNLDYLNVSNFQTSSSLEYSNDFKIFSSTQKDFNYCLKGYNEPNIGDYFGLQSYPYAIRDCSSNCFANDKLYAIPIKICVDNCTLINYYFYNNICYDTCPKRTKSFDNITCEYLHCEHNNTYYNYEQHDCIQSVTDGYYVNDTHLNTIDICPRQCKLCNTSSVNNNNSCISCNDSYYQKIDEDLNINSYVKCYNRIQGYYLDNIDLYFKPCYGSCKTCEINGSEIFHNCTKCDNNYTYNFSLGNYTNCFQEETYYYFDINNTQYHFIYDSTCPYNYNKLIFPKKQCIENCSLDNTYKYEFRKHCYDQCPSDSKKSENKSNYCDPICPFNKPFEIIETQECVENCNISFLYNKKCRLNYDKTNADLFWNNINKEIISEEFNFSEINNNNDILFEENNMSIIITKENKNLTNLEECEFMLRNYYNISNEDTLYKIIQLNNTNNNINSNNKYQIFYSFNGIQLEKLNLNLCNYTCNEPKCNECTMRSIILYNQCISCNYNNAYYPILNDSTNIYPYINCYQNPEGYYLDALLYKPCFNSCKTCDIEGDNENHNCISCSSDYIYELNTNNNINCYKVCQNYSYFNNQTNKSYCTPELKCPNEFSKLIKENKQCIEDCKKDSTYKYEYKNECYAICPDNTVLSEIIEFYCIPKCTEEFPYVLIESQECVNNCTIDEIKNKICEYNYDKTNVKIITNYLSKEIEKGNFNVTDVYNGNNITIEEKYAKFSITMNNINELFECGNILRNYYNINNNQNLIKLVTEYKENETFINKEYNLFYEINNTYLQQLDISICSCRNEKCSLCSNISIKNNQCISCNYNNSYYPILNDSYNIYPYINCYQNPEGYYLDINAQLYKPCFNSCKTCDIEGNEENHYCTSCDDKYIYELNINNNYTNCYSECKYYYYFDKKAQRNYCTSIAKCPDEYSKLKLDNKQCIEDCKLDSTYKYEFRNNCYTICPENTELSKTKEYYCNVKCTKQYPFEIVNTQECVNNCTINDRKNKLCIINYISEDEDSSKVQDEAINNIREDLTSGFDVTDIDQGGDIVIEEKGTKLTITNTENQKDNEKNKDSTTINLGDCETNLKQHYQIPLNKSLYILKLDVYQPGMKIPKIEYEVYYNLYGGNLVKLNLTVCENTKIHISLPVKLNEDLDKLNSSSAYYHDICYTSTSDSGTDISLSDRQNDFINNNKTLCEENCDLSKYNYEISKAICSCGIKLNIPSVSDINIDNNKNKFFEGFTDINNLINYKILKCYKNLFDINKLKYIYGSFILIPLILFHFVCLIIACVKGNNELKEQIKYIVEAKNKYILIKKDYLKYKKNIHMKNDIRKSINN